MDNPPYDLPLPDLIDHTAAQPVAVEMLGHLLWMERASEGRFRWCRTAAEIRAAMAAGVVAGVIHFEGAEPIGPDLDALHLFHAMGLRSLGPVWSRPTIFGHGVPFRFPSTGDTGPGLTDLGKALVRECNACGSCSTCPPERGRVLGRGESCRTRRWSPPIPTPMPSPPPAATCRTGSCGRLAKPAAWSG
jgi:hypothetical protein